MFLCVSMFVCLRVPVWFYRCFRVFLHVSMVVSVCFMCFYDFCFVCFCMFLCLLCVLRFVPMCVSVRVSVCIFFVLCEFLFVSTLVSMCFYLFP